MSTYAIGDIHGCLEETRTIVETLRSEESLRPDDTLVFLGDYVDRGPDSKGVIDYLIELNQSQRCIFLMGNHEDMMLWWLGIEHGRRRIELRLQAQYAGVWIPNGGDKTLDSYGIDMFDYRGRLDEIIQALPENHLEFLKELKYYYIDGSNLYVHAGVGWQGMLAETPEEAVDVSSDENLLWDRLSYQHPNDFGTMIYGHTPSKKGVRWNRREEGAPFSVGMDVGCVFGANPLVAVRTDDWAEIWPKPEESSDDD